MLKMKKLFKFRNMLIPWFHWSTIHFILNTASLLALFITICFAGITEFAFIWFILCIFQYLPIFIVMTVCYIFETILYKNVLTIIKRRLTENQVDIKALNMFVNDFTFYSCNICVNYNRNVMHEIVFKDIVYKMNETFGNGYQIYFRNPKSENTD